MEKVGMVRFVTLLNNREILGKITETDDTYIIEDPFGVAVQENKVMFYCPQPFAKDSRQMIVFKRVVIGPPTEPDEQLVAAYTKQTSGIIIDAKSEIITPV